MWGNQKGRNIPMNMDSGPKIPMNMSSGSKIPMKVLSDQSNSQCISKYFRGAKTNSKPFESNATTSKHLQTKYDNFSSQPIHIPEKIPFPTLGSKRENESRRNDNAQQMTARQDEFNPPPNKVQKQIFTTADEKVVNNTPMKKVKSNTIHLIGYVENALNWYRTMKNEEIFVVYNVVGKFIIAKDGALEFEKCVFIRGINGRILECRYFEVDCPLPIITKGQLVACLGHVTGEEKFTLYNIYVLNETTNLDIQRAIFSSQRTVLEHYSDNKSRLLR